MQDLPDSIGISRRTLFAGRTGDNGVSSKTWARLEEAERTAGLCEKKPGDVVREKDVNNQIGKSEASKEENRQFLSAPLTFPSTPLYRPEMTTKAFAKKSSELRSEAQKLRAMAARLAGESQELLITAAAYEQWADAMLEDDDDEEAD